MKRDPMSQVPERYVVRVGGEYEGRDWEWRGLAYSRQDAACKAAEFAHAEWAWEVGFPLTFLVTDSSNRVSWVEVDRQVCAQFEVIDSESPERLESPT